MLVDYVHDWYNHHKIGMVARKVLCCIIENLLKSQDNGVGRPTALSTHTPEAAELHDQHPRRDHRVQPRGGIWNLVEPSASHCDTIPLP